MAKIAELEAKLYGGKKKKQDAPKAELGFGDLHDKEENQALLSFDDIDNKTPLDDVPKKGSLSFEAFEAKGSLPAVQIKESLSSKDTPVAVESSAVTNVTPAAGGKNHVLELSGLLSESSDSDSDSEEDTALDL